MPKQKHITRVYTSTKTWCILSTQLLNEFYFFVDWLFSLFLAQKFIMHCLNLSKFKHINQSGHIYIHIHSNRMWMKIKITNKDGPKIRWLWLVCSPRFQRIMNRTILYILSEIFSILICWRDSYSNLHLILNKMEFCHNWNDYFCSKHLKYLRC